MQARHKSMKAFGENLALANEQLKILDNENGLAHFDKKYELLGEGFLKASDIEILQVNVGKMCNQVCKHCHVDAGLTLTGPLNLLLLFSVSPYLNFKYHTTTSVVTIILNDFDLGQAI